MDEEAVSNGIKETCLVQNEQDVVMPAVHTGLECGIFAALDPGSDMISTGPDIDLEEVLRWQRKEQRRLRYCWLFPW